LKVISPLGVEASLKAVEELSSGESAQRAAPSSKLEQLEYEAKRAFEQYDVVDARNRLAAAELERPWNEKLEEIDTVRQQLACFAERRSSLSSTEEASLRALLRGLAQRSLPTHIKENDLSHGYRRDHRAFGCGEENSALHHSLERGRAHPAEHGSSALAHRNGDAHGSCGDHSSDGGMPRR
jgi:hypothetical protein